MGDMAWVRAEKTNNDIWICVVILSGDKTTYFVGQYIQSYKSQQQFIFSGGYIMELPSQVIEWTSMAYTSFGR